MVKLRVSDVAPGGVLRERSTVIQQKTGWPVPFEITEPTRVSLAAWLERRVDAQTSSNLRGGWPRVLRDRSELP